MIGQLVNDGLRKWSAVGLDCYAGSRTKFWNRLGVSLIELLVVISASAVLMSMVGVWTFKLLQFSSNIRQKQDDMVGMNRLAVDFRRDVRFADQIEVGIQGDVKLQHAGGNLIIYRLVNEHLSCTVQVQRKIGDQLMRQEEYRLSENCLASWDWSEFPDWVSLVIYRRSNFKLAAEWPDGKESQASIIAVEDRSTDPILDPDTIATLTEKIGPVELQVRVAPRRWGEWKFVDE